MQTFNQYRNQRGTVMVYILVAIGLFSALTYAISSGNRTNTSAITEQQASLAAQEMIEYASSVATAVQKLKLRGFEEYELDFSNNVYKLTDDTPFPAANSSCTSSACRIFDVNGGGLEAVYAPDHAHISASSLPGGTGSTSGQGNFRSNYVQGVGSTAPDLVFEYTYISPVVCKKINELLGIDNPSDAPPVDTYDQQNYSGNLTTFPLPPGPDVIGDSATGLAGKTAFCLTTDGTYFNFKQVILTR